MGGGDEEDGVRRVVVLFGPDHGGDEQGEVRLIEEHFFLAKAVIEPDAERAVRAEEELGADAVGVFAAGGAGGVVGEEEALG